jgi:hypothetical protein
MVGIPGLDRKAMEAERLARMATRGTTVTANAQGSAKRARSISPPAITRPAKVAKVHETVTIPDSPKVQESITIPDSPPPKTTNYTLTEEPTSSSNLRFPFGKIMKTWALGHARTASDIKIEEVLEKSTLRTALLSAFQWDVPWIMSKLNLQQTKSVFVMQAKDEATKIQYRQETEYMRKILRLCFPSMQGNVNCMHSKLMLLFHPHKLRVVVPSANLTSYDWGETGIMENTVFLIDLPRLDEARHANTLSQFGQELLYFLDKMGCDEDIRNGLLNFDFAKTEDIAFVHSVGGAHYGADLERTGYAGLSKAVRELIRGGSLATKPGLYIDYAASSIGSLTDDFLSIIHNAARGEDATALPKTKSTATSRAAPKPFQNSIINTNIRDLFRIYFPTQNTVSNSTGGLLNGGTICLQRKWWEGNNSFPRTCFRDHRSTRPGMLSHNKLLYARGINAKGKAVAWVYAGSANLSESAWGKMSWDRSKKEWKMGCRNWECGVVISVPADKHTQGMSIEQHARQTKKQKQDLPPEEVETESEDDGQETDDGEQTEDVLPRMNVFGGIADLPFEYPGAEYDGKEPWYFME